VELKVFWLDSYSSTTRGYISVYSVGIDSGHKTYHRTAQHTAIPRNNVPGSPFNQTKDTGRAKEKGEARGREAKGADSSLKQDPESDKSELE